MPHSAWPDHPRIYEINAWVWLQDLSLRARRPVTLAGVPEEALEPAGHFDAVWLMGVWQRSPKARLLAVNHPGLRREFHEVLSDFSPADVTGSPYAVQAYEVDPHLGGAEGLAVFREQLARRGLRLMLDFVPNHVALDHPWTRDCPDLFMSGTEKDLEAAPGQFFRSGGRIFAHGRDPYFPPWTDTAQIHAFSPQAREQALLTLSRLAGICDGVRCDMAMLLLTQIFLRTWGSRAGEPPRREFWEEIIPPVKKIRPDFCFLAEVYWDFEWTLQRLGFDYCYDKRLYDRLLHEDARAVSLHLWAEWEYQRRLLRFIENHDEPRAAAVFGLERSRAAALLAVTLPGAVLIHEGQMHGRRLKLPIQLGRRPAELDHPELLKYYERLLDLSGPDMKNGAWGLCRVEPRGPENATHRNLIATLWQQDDRRRLVVVNFSAAPAQGHVRLGGVSYGDRSWRFTDLLTDGRYEYQGADLRRAGLYVDLPAWGGHLFSVQPA